jgi:hypothetical protein
MKTKAAGILLAGGLLAISSLPTAAHAEEPRSRGEFGLYFAIAPGVVGDLRNGPVQISPGLSLAAGSVVRYHLLVGFAHLDPLNGFDVQPLTFGFPIHVVGSRDLEFAIEPLLNLVELEAYFTGSAAAFLFESGAGLQAVFNFRVGFVSISPLNFQFRYAIVATGPGVLAAGTGFGMNMPIRITGGVRF